MYCLNNSTKKQWYSKLLQKRRKIVSLNTIKVFKEKLLLKKSILWTILVASQYSGYVNTVGVFLCNQCCSWRLIAENYTSSIYLLIFTNSLPNPLYHRYTIFIDSDPFHATDSFLYPQKASENICCCHVFRIKSAHGRFFCRFYGTFRWHIRTSISLIFVRTTTVFWDGNSNPTYCEFWNKTGSA